MFADLLVFLLLISCLLFVNGDSSRQLVRAEVRINRLRPERLPTSKLLSTNPVWADADRPTPRKAAVTSRFSTYSIKGRPQ
jgi:hypothetical protein